MKSLKTLGIAGSLIAAALVGGTLISAASAAPSSSQSSGSALANDAAKGAYCTTWKTTFADQLGVSVDKLLPAAKAASIAAVDEAVKNGDLTADEATAIKARINAATGDGCKFLGGFLQRFGQDHPLAGGRHDLLDAAAGALGITSEDLVSALRNGDSLKQIATDHKVSYDTVSLAVVTAARTDLDALVKNGKITQAREDTMLARLKDALAAGHFPGRPGPFGDKHGDGPMGAPMS
jgi:hypothetical protein